LFLFAADLSSSSQAQQRQRAATAPAFAAALHKLTEESQQKSSLIEGGQVGDPTGQLEVFVLCAFAADLSSSSQQQQRQRAATVKLILSSSTQAHRRVTTEVSFICGFK